MRLHERVSAQSRRSRKATEQTERKFVRTPARTVVSIDQMPSDPVPLTSRQTESAGSLSRTAAAATTAGITAGGGLHSRSS